ncbi:hypothetical protein chiPu_0024922 [Chiloscyllium punctatum]|uniref:Uncharacterized protein n=1 Tax=Chiloscyllium punctatum TaxID=137246 RepID=A0A401TD03_CHIPU|nr:hypothetical protein [Chiloscyllium punctatum]
MDRAVGRWRGFKNVSCRPETAGGKTLPLAPERARIAGLLPAIWALFGTVAIFVGGSGRQQACAKRMGGEGQLLE